MCRPSFCIAGIANVADKIARVEHLPYLEVFCITVEMSIIICLLAGICRVNDVASHWTIINSSDDCFCWRDDKSPSGSQNVYSFVVSATGSRISPAIVEVVSANSQKNWNDKIHNRFVRQSFHLLAYLAI